MAKIKKLKRKQEKNWKDKFWIGFIVFVVLFSLSLTILVNLGNDEKRKTVVKILKKEIVKPKLLNFKPENRKKDLTHLITADIFGQKAPFLVEGKKYNELSVNDTMEVQYKIRFNGTYKILNYFNINK